MNTFWKGSVDGKVRVLVTGVGGNVAQGVLKALKHCGLASWVVGTDAHPLSPGLYLADRGYTVPMATDPDFFDSFSKIIRNEKIDLVFVGADTETLPLAEMKERLEKATNARILVNPAEIVRKCSDKWETAQLFACKDLPHPDTVLAEDREGLEELIQRHGYPLIAKPRCGYASRGIMVVRNKEEAHAASMMLGKDGVIQKLVGTDETEFTASIYSSAPGQVDACIVLWRELLQGTSYRVESCLDSALMDEVKRWGQVIGSVGSLNFQFRVTENGPICFEINPRISGTMGIRYHLGYNDVEMAIRQHCFGETITQPTIRQGVVLRYWEELYLPDVSIDGLREGMTAGDKAVG